MLELSQGSALPLGRAEAVRASRPLLWSLKAFSLHLRHVSGEPGPASAGSVTVRNDGPVGLGEKGTAPLGRWGGWLGRGCPPPLAQLRWLGRFGEMCSALWRPILQGDKALLCQSGFFFST